MKTKTHYKISLESRPERLGELAISVAAKMDRLQFPGCEVADWSRSWLWLAFNSAGSPVGFSSMRYLPAEGYGFFQRAGVLAAHRRRGLHRRLIRCRISAARRMGWRGVLTYTAVDNCASANSLVSMGFRLYTPKTKYAGSQFLYFYLPLGDA